MRLVRGGLVVVVVWTAACGGSDDAPNGVTVRDSSDIRIVETTAEERSAAAWRIADAPAWSVGEAGGDGDYLLSRVVGATQLRDGRVLVANGGTNEVRAYDPDGTFVQTIGRDGRGPGEFEYLRALRPCREAGFIAFDLNWQVNAFGPDGTFLGRDVLTTPEGFTPYTVACDAEGRFLLLGWGIDRSAGPRPGFHAVHDRLLLITLEGGVEADFGRWLTSERIGSPNGSRPHPAGRATVFDLHGGQVFVGSGERFEVEVRDLDGTLTSLVRGPHLTLQVTDSIKDLTLEAMLRGVDASRQPALRTTVRGWDWPESVPAYTALRVDSEGVVWTRAYSADPLEGELWSLLDPEEGYLGDLQLSPGQTLLEAGGDYVLVLSRDDLDVERVERYELTRM